MPPLRHCARATSLMLVGLLSSLLGACTRSVRLVVFNLDPGAVRQDDFSPSTPWKGGAIDRDLQLGVVDTASAESPRAHRRRRRSSK
jgi:hypothetical protein